MVRRWLDRTVCAASRIRHPSLSQGCCLALLALAIDPGPPPLLLWGCACLWPAVPRAKRPPLPPVSPPPRSRAAPTTTMLGCDTVVSTAISSASFIACRSCCRAYMTLTAATDPFHVPLYT